MVFSSLSVSETITECGNTALYFPQDFLQEVQFKLDDLESGLVVKPYLYPWVDLQKQDLPISIVGIGSLLNSNDAFRTLKHMQFHDRKPVYAFGAKRIFNMKMSEQNVHRLAASSQGMNIIPSQCAVLNTDVTYKVDNFFNGIEFLLYPGDLAAFREREVGYDLFPVVTSSWSDSNKLLGISYVLTCRTVYYNDRHMLSNDIYPHPKYLQTCEDGCLEISPEFLQCFYRTTFTN